MLGPLHDETPSLSIPWGAFLLFLFELSQWSSDRWGSTPMSCWSQPAPFLAQSAATAIQTESSPKWRRAGALFTLPPSLWAMAVSDIWVARYALLPRLSCPVISPCASGLDVSWEGAGRGSRVSGSSAPDGPQGKPHILVGSMARKVKIVELDTEGLLFKFWPEQGGPRDCAVVSSYCTFRVGLLKR